MALKADASSAVAVRATSTAAAAVSATSTHGAGVTATSESGTGVKAVSRAGLGASLEGGSAAVRLVPQSKAGHPASGRHLRGELLVDSSGRLWLCTKAGTPGTWRQLAFV